MPSAKTSRKQTVSIVIPMCNEEESISILKEKLAVLHRKLAIDFAVEYCLVDDGSSDRTWELMPAVVPQGARYAWRRHNTNRGLGAAIRTGFKAASGDIVCTIDADCSYSPENLSSLIGVVISGAADVAVASPYHPQGRVAGVAPWRLLLSRKCSSLYRILSPLKLYTYTSIFRAYRRSVVRDLQFHSNGFVSAVEILLRAHRLGYRITEVPLELRARQHGYSKIRIVRTICIHLWMMASLVQMRIAGRIHSRRAIARVLEPAETTAAVSVAVRFGEENSSAG